MDDEVDAMDGKVDMEEEHSPVSPQSMRIPPGCALGSTLSATFDSAASTTLNSTGKLSEFSSAGQSLESTMLDERSIIELPVSQESGQRPRTADPRLIEDLRRAIEADSTGLLPGGSEIHQRTCALRQKTLDLIARDSSLGPWEHSPQADEGYPCHRLRSAPHCARPGFLLSQSPNPSGMNYTDDFWREKCTRERKYLQTPQRTAPQECGEIKKPAGPLKKRTDNAGSQWGPRPAVRRVGHGPKGGCFARNQVALLGGIPMTCVDLEN